MMPFFKISFAGSYKALTTFIAIILVLESCKKEDVVFNIPTAKDSIQSINKWVLDSMKHYYYHNSLISPAVSLEGSTEAFFNRLVNPADKFSWISNGQNIPAPKNCFDLYGFHYILVENTAYSADKLLGVMSLVAGESAAERAGFERGFYFSKINGQAITKNNLAAMQTLLNSGNNISITTVSNATGSWVESAPQVLPATVFEERPVYTTRVFEKNAKKTGYIFYRLFNEKFDLDLLNAFDKLKSKNVTELIIDLRYNAGGSVASCAKLCALIGNVKATDVFGIYKGNATLQNVSQTFEKAINASPNSSGKNFATLVSKRLSIQKVYVLSTAVTASAAELLINNLQPYINVVHIGEKTYGKNYAAILISDQRQPKKIAWYMQPIAYKLYNALNKGDYENGLVPTMAVNEFESLPLSKLNSPDDLLVKKALTDIYGDNKVTTELLRPVKPIKQMQTGKLIYNSIKSNTEERIPVVF